MKKLTSVIAIKLSEWNQWLWRYISQGKKGALRQQDLDNINTGDIWITLGLALVGQVFPLLERVEASRHQGVVYLKCYVKGSPSAADRATLREIQNRMEEALRGFDIRFKVLKLKSYNRRDGFGTVFARRGSLT